MLKWIMFFSLFAVVSCSSLSDKAKKLKVTSNKEDVKECLKTASVTAESGYSNDFTMVMIGNHNSGVKMRNMAAEHGDTLLIVKDDEGLLGSERQGVVYQCEKEMMN